MSSTRELEDTLPLSAPRSIQDITKLKGKKYAVYTLLDLDLEELAQVQHDLNNNKNTIGAGHCHLAPCPSFVGKALRHVYEHHINTRDNGDVIGYWHPLYFVVIDSRSWNAGGVLFVNLNVINDREQSVIGVCRCEVGMANTMGAYVESGNMDWMDFKEDEQNVWGGENPSDNPRYRIQ